MLYTSTLSNLWQFSSISIFLCYLVSQLFKFCQGKGSWVKEIASSHHCQGIVDSDSDFDPIPLENEKCQYFTKGRVQILNFRNQPTIFPSTTVFSSKKLSFRPIFDGIFLPWNRGIRHIAMTLLSGPFHKTFPREMFRSQYHHSENYGLKSWK